MPAHAATLTRGRELSALLSTQQLARLWTSFRPATQREWISLSAFQAYRAQGLAKYGREQRLLSEEVRQYPKVSYYLRTATFQRGPQHAWTLILGLDSGGQVVAFGIVAAHALTSRAARQQGPSSP